jgi:antitoxin component of RelBE/YafQ-DinJ toxin-antitoxin module
MKKTVNLTVRIDPKLREEAEQAAAYFDTDVSKVIRKALRNLVHEHKRNSQLDKIKEIREMENPTPVVEVVDGQPKAALSDPATARRVRRQFTVIGSFVKGTKEEADS